MKKVQDIMTAQPACCSPDTSLQEVARLMVEHDCGCIPVVETRSPPTPVGVVTDRDVCCRTVASGRDPLHMTAGEVMTSPAVTVTPDMSVDDCCQVMEDNLIRRVVVVDEQGSCCGIVAQADLAQHTAKQKTGEVVRKVSEPTEIASRPAAGQPMQPN
jgi:CBS domain-containing protein